MGQRIGSRLYWFIGRIRLRCGEISGKNGFPKILSSDMLLSQIMKGTKIQNEGFSSPQVNSRKT